MESNVPPLYSTPPPLIPPPRPRQTSKGTGWIWLVVALFCAFVALLLIAGSLSQTLGGLSFGATTGRESGRMLEEVVVERNNSRNKVALIDVEGLISGEPWDRSGRGMVELIADQLKVAAEDDAVKAVVLKVDSPGGEVLASDDISRAVTEFQESTGKPVIAAMGGLAASGGYYVSAPCRWIVANELTITGSIGVIMHSFNYRELMDKVGLYPQVFKSGKFKDMLSGSKKLEEIDPEEREMIQAMINETFEKFKNVVAEGRGRATKENQGQGRELVANWTEYADGRVLTGKQAFELGFVDQLGNFDTAVERAKTLANIQEANLIRYQEHFDLSHLFSLFGRSESKNLKVDFGIDLPKLQAGRMYFLSPTFVH
jgi:protease IV